MKIFRRILLGVHILFGISIIPIALVAPYALYYVFFIVGSYGTVMIMLCKIRAATPRSALPHRKVPWQHLIDRYMEHDSPMFGFELENEVEEWKPE